LYLLLKCLNILDKSYDNIRSLLQKSSPLKVFDYVFSKNVSKLLILVQAPNFRKKKHFWTHVIVGCCSKIVWEDMEKNFRNFHLVDYKILGFEVTKFLFSALQKTTQLHFTRSHLYEIMFKMVVTLWIHSSKQVGYMLEKFRIIWNCTICRKK